MLGRNKEFIDLVALSAEYARLKGIESAFEYYSKNYADNYTTPHQRATFEMITKISEPYVESFAREFAQHLVDNKYLFKELLFPENDNLSHNKNFVSFVSSIVFR